MGRHRDKLYNGLFKDYNSISCYWLGMITADGSLSKNKDVKLALKTEDCYLVKQLAIDAGYGESKVKWRENGYTGLCSCVLNAEAYDDLINMGLMQQKCKKLGKNNVPNVFFNDFFRGLFDGDGSAGLYAPQYSCGIYGYRPFLLAIQGKLLMYNIKSKLYFTGKKYNSHVHRLSIQDKSSFRGVYNLMYKGMSSSLYRGMYRKYESMCKILEYIESMPNKYSHIYRYNDRSADNYKCLFCKKIFIARTRYQNNTPKFCSSRCSGLYRTKPVRVGGRSAVYKICEHCNKNYLARTDTAHNRKYCSNQCSANARRLQ